MTELEIAKERAAMTSGMRTHQPTPPSRWLSNVLATIVGMGLGLACFASSASADLHLVDFSGGLFKQDATSFTQAGGHPHSGSANILFTGADSFTPEASLKDVFTELPPGLVGNAMAVPGECTGKQLYEREFDPPLCPVSSQVGVAEVTYAGFGGSPLNFGTFNVYKMVPPPGVPAMFGFVVFAQSVFLIPKLRSDEDYGLSLGSPQTSQLIPVIGAKVTLWGNPADPSHDDERGTGLDAGLSEGKIQAQCSATFATPDCSNPAGYTSKALITNSTHCAAGPLTTRLRANSWQDPDTYVTASFDHDSNGNSTQPTGCDKVPFDPSMSAQHTTDSADTPRGLNFELTIPTSGLLNPDGIAQANVKKTVVSLPEGMSLNPSAAEGLGACTPADFARQTLNSDPGYGCPNWSK